MKIVGLFIRNKIVEIINNIYRGRKELYPLLMFPCFYVVGMVALEIPCDPFIGMAHDLITHPGIVTNIIIPTVAGLLIVVSPFLLIGTVILIWIIAECLYHSSHRFVKWIKRNIVLANKGTKVPFEWKKD